MRYAGIDVGSKTHVVAIVAANGEVLVKSTSFGEDAAGYDKLLGLLGSAADLVVALEATGHYGKNLCAFLRQRAYGVAVINPIRTHRFAQEDLARAKTDSIDALGIARFALQKALGPQPPMDPRTHELRELVFFHERLVQDFGDRLRQLHRLVHLGFPELPRLVRTLDSQLATTILHEYPTAASFDDSCLRKLARLRYDSRHAVGLARARQIVEIARTSIGQHHGLAFQARVRYVCQDLDSLRTKTNALIADIENAVRDLPLAALLTSIPGVALLTAARIIATVENPIRFRNAASFAAYVGVVPATRLSGLHRPAHAPISPVGNARLRKALWMPVLTAVRYNPWLRDYYQRLRARGKHPKVALTAAMRKLLTAIYSVAKYQRPFSAPPTPSETAPRPPST
jgi:transposase